MSVNNTVIENIISAFRQNTLSQLDQLQRNLSSLNCVDNNVLAGRPLENMSTGRLSVGSLSIGQPIYEQQQQQAMQQQQVPEQAMQQQQQQQQAMQQQQQQLMQQQLMQQQQQQQQQLQQQQLPMPQSEQQLPALVQEQPQHDEKPPLPPRDDEEYEDDEENSRPLSAEEINRDYPNGPIIRKKKGLFKMAEQFLSPGKSCTEPYNNESIGDGTKWTVPPDPRTWRCSNGRIELARQPKTGLIQGIAQALSSGLPPDGTGVELQPNPGGISFADTMWSLAGSPKKSCNSENNGVRWSPNHGIAWKTHDGLFFKCVDGNIIPYEPTVATPMQAPSGNSLEMQSQAPSGNPLEMQSQSPSGNPLENYKITKPGFFSRWTSAGGRGCTKEINGDVNNVQEIPHGGTIENKKTGQIDTCNDGTLTRTKYSNEPGVTPPGFIYNIQQNNQERRQARRDSVEDGASAPGLFSRIKGFFSPSKKNSGTDTQGKGIVPEVNQNEQSHLDESEFEQENPYSDDDFEYITAEGPNNAGENVADILAAKPIDPPQSSLINTLYKDDSSQEQLPIPKNPASSIPPPQPALFTPPSPPPQKPQISPASKQRLINDQSSEGSFLDEISSGNFKLKRTPPSSPRTNGAELSDLERGILKQRYHQNKLDKDAACTLFGSNSEECIDATAESNSEDNDESGWDDEDFNTARSEYS
jgi:hypothetical protein